MEDKQIENAVNETIKDLKQFFRFQKPNKMVKHKTLFIPEHKIGNLRYLLIKNIKSQTKAKENYGQQNKNTQKEVLLPERTDLNKTGGTGFADTPRGSQDDTTKTKAITKEKKCLN